MYRNMPATTGCQALKQPPQHGGAGRMVIADIGHQLPALLSDFERAMRLADLGDIIL